MVSKFFSVLQIGFVPNPNPNPAFSSKEESGFITVSVGILSTTVALVNDFIVNLEIMDIAGIQNAAQGSCVRP